MQLFKIILKNPPSPPPSSSYPASNLWQCKSFSLRDILSSLMVCSSSSYCLLSTMGDRNQWIVLKDWQNGKNSLIKKDTQPFKIISMNDSFPILQVLMIMFPVNRFPSLSHPLNWAQNMAIYISSCYKKLDVNQYLLGRQFSHSLSLSKFEVVAHHGIQTQSTMHL